MKAFYVLCYTVFLLFLPSLLQAQVPQRIPYRAMLKINSSPIASQTIDMRFTILESGTTTVYQETQTLMTNAVGLVSSAIGDGTPISGILSSIAWDQGDYSMEVEFDNGGMWTSLGITPLQTVPFAFHAQTVANDSSNSYEIDYNGTELILMENGSAKDSLDLAMLAGNNWQAGPGIDVTGNVISNSGDINSFDDITVGSVAGGDLGGTYPNPVVQAIHGFPITSTVPANGQVLKFTNGQWVPSDDLFEDGDIDPTNEIQSLSQNGNQLSLSSGGNTVTLFTSGQGINVVGNQIINTGDIDPSNDITTATSAGGDLNGLYPDPTVIAIQGQSVSSAVPQTGEVLKWDGTQWEADTDNSPWTQSGNDLSYSTGDVGIGTASPASELSVGGTATVLNSSGSVRVEAGTGTNDGGFVRIMDTNNQILAGMFINALGEGDLFADTKNFRVDHPTEPDKDIWYASLEGPEAAAYVRGTATLQDGKVLVELPDHFELIAANEGMTVMLTPLSAESKGLAVVQKDVRQFEVQELLQGKGNYSFDWEVKAVRKGHEDFQVIRPALSPRK